ncbi:MAG: septum formation initiator family protein [Paludibacter sp.]|nr:septum formation initiator family protein [Paludibacter sp.]
MSFIKKTLRILRLIFINKYLIVFSVFFVYVLFLDDHNLITRWKMDTKIVELKNEYQYYKKEIEDNKKKLNDLQHDDEYLEKFAREKYLMKKADEEIFIIK